jgi:Secretion system C-terminal sorting domain
MKTFTACFLFAFAMIVQGYSQSGCCPYIGPIEIIPPQPTTQDIVRIVTQTTTPNQGNEISYSFVVQGNTIQLSGCFYDGLLPATQTFLDTTVVGYLQAGFLTVNYVATISYTDSACVPVDSSSLNMGFQVAILDAIAAETINRDDISIYPNPVAEFLSVKAPVTYTQMSVELRNACGQVCYRGTQKAGEKIDLRPLANGMYWVVILANDQRAAFSLRKD